MAYAATIIPVMIASPGDVHPERNIIREVIHEWNAINSLSTAVALLPVGWDSHSSPDLSATPQELINKYVLEQCDLLVAVFWTRLGTATQQAASGTVEEIERHLNSGKPAMVYFSSAPVAPDNLDAEQYKNLSDFKKWCMTKGIISSYANTEEFRALFSRDLSITMHNQEHLQTLIKSQETENDTPPSVNIPRLSEAAETLLKEAAADPSGEIIMINMMGGKLIQTNGKSFGEGEGHRILARWISGVEELIENRFIASAGGKHEIYRVTEKGYQYIES